MGRGRALERRSVSIRALCAVTGSRCKSGAAPAAVSLTNSQIKPLLSYREGGKARRRTTASQKTGRAKVQPQARLARRATQIGRASCRERV